MPPPLVSVVIPAYQAADFITRSVSSALGQSYPSLETIVVNDGSPDTEQLRRALQPFASRIQYLEQDNNGAAAARNTGIHASRGEFVAFLDADDRWETDFVESQLELLAAPPRADLVYSNARLVGAPWLEGRTSFSTAGGIQNVTALDLIRADAVVVTSSVLTRRSILDEVGLFDTSPRISEDFDLWLRIAMHGGRIRYTSKPLVTRTVRPGSLSADDEQMIGRIIYAYSLAEDRADSAELRDEIKRQIELFQGRLSLTVGKRHLREGHYKEASRRFEEAASTLHRPKLWIVYWLSRVAPDLTRRLVSLRGTLWPRHRGTA